jgi:hypothetical protein
MSMNEEIPVTNAFVLSRLARRISRIEFFILLYNRPVAGFIIHKLLHQKRGY